jgi:hypothetical protein
MKNQDKISLPKIRIKQVQVLNRVFTANNTIKNGSGINALMGTTTVETVATTVSTGF